MVEVVMSLGPNGGVGQTKGGTIIPEFAVKGLKSKGMLADRYWKDFHQTMPTK